MFKFGFKNSFSQLGRFCCLTIAERRHMRAVEKLAQELRCFGLYGILVE